MPNDTGAQLRSLYEPEGGVGEIFSSKVSDYRSSRPDYPASLFEYLRHAGNLDRDAVVADVGAGTGLLTKGLLEQGYSVTAIEPNAAMRAACDRWLAGYASYRSVAGAAESIAAASCSFDLITAAQAFHWFDVERAKAEFLRVLRPHGKVALIWNDRVRSDPLHVALDNIFTCHGGGKRDALLRHESREDVATFFGSAALTELTWPHEHRLDESGLMSLVFSRSYMPERTSVLGKQVCQQLSDIFRQFETQGGVDVRYTTVAIVGRPQ